MLTAARRDLPYAEIRDLAGRLLSTDDVMPGVMEMIPLICIEAGFAEGTKLIAIFDPIRPGDDAALLAPDDAIVPGEIITPDEDLELFAGADVVELEVMNTGDRDIQVRSHAHFFEANRGAAFRPRRILGPQAGRARRRRRAVRTGHPETCPLVPIQGLRMVLGQAGLVQRRPGHRRGAARRGTGTRHIHADIAGA